MRFVLSLILLLTFSLNMGFAEDKAKDKKEKTPEQRFAAKDKDDDGKLSLEEFVGKKEGEDKEKATKMFGRKDKDGDGSLTLEEFKAKAGKKGGKKGGDKKKGA